jgi:hypothetical protein
MEPNLFVQEGVIDQKGQDVVMVATIIIAITIVTAVTVVPAQTMVVITGQGNVVWTSAQLQSKPQAICPIRRIG